MADLVVSLLAVVAFGLALRWTGLVPATQRTMGLSVAGLMAMLDPGADDRAKEVAARRAGLALVVGSLGILWRGAVAIAAAAAPVVAADALGAADRDDVVALMVRWDWIVAVSVAAIVVVAVVRRVRPTTPPEADGEDEYSPADQLLHAMAFASPRVLRAASRVEDRLVSGSADEPAAPPIFVTSIARAGTTALLNALHDVPGVATHTYRDMPFLTAPSLWNTVAGGRRRRVEEHERAHGDGLEIGLDSPEAFEEIVWRMGWPDKYRDDVIDRWGRDDHDPDAEAFLAHHMGKVVRARRVQSDEPDVPAARYCSKNNANVARLTFLPEAFPGCRIVVPLRRPECHAASLLRQHDNFLARQAEDPFVERYMRDLGHFEFGRIHRPIAFPGFDPGRYAPTTPDYWLHYWVAAFREVLAHRDRCLLVGQDDLRAAPAATMEALCDRLGLAHDAVDFTDHFRPTPDEAPTDVFDPALYAEAAGLYRELEALTVTGVAPAGR